MNNNKDKKKHNFFNIIKNVFVLLLFLQFAPTIINNIKNYIQDAITPKSYVGELNIVEKIYSSNFYIKKIQQFLKDPKIKALFIRIDSPGGLPGTSYAIFNELIKFKKEKPIITLTENVCASGGYYIAAASNHIIASPNALVGSIGVLLQLPNVKDLLTNWKIKFQFVQSGKYKTAGSPLKDLTAEEITYLQNLSDENYKQFTQEIAKVRNLDLNQKQVWANGKLFLGNTALQLNLIDQIGSYSDAIEKIKEIAKIKNEIKFITAKKSTGLLKLLKGNNSEDLEESLDLSSKFANFLHSVYLKLLSKPTNIQ